MNNNNNNKETPTRTLQTQHIEIYTGRGFIVRHEALQIICHTKTTPFCLMPRFLTLCEFLFHNLWLHVVAKPANFWSFDTKLKAMLGNCSIWCAWSSRLPTVSKARDFRFWKRQNRLPSTPRPWLGRELLEHHQIPKKPKTIFSNYLLACIHPDQCAVEIWLGCGRELSSAFFRRAFRDAKCALTCRNVPWALGNHLQFLIFDHRSLRQPASFMSLG